MRNVFLIAILIALIVVSPLSNSRAGQTAQPQNSRSVFVEVPPSKSKITWVHDNGRSEAHHLPETCGGGGLFFDYDNDGWMDIYLVNSGPSDFYTPARPIRNA